MFSRPYRPAGSWESAGHEILAQEGTQFDPAVVKVFAECETNLRRIRRLGRALDGGHSAFGPIADGPDAKQRRRRRQNSADQM